MNDNDLVNIPDNSSCPDCEHYRFGLIVILIFTFFFLLVMCFELCLDISSSIKDSHINNDLEILCNQLHDTNSCSFVYKNDNVVLFDTYNGYVTMENILK